METTLINPWRGLGGLPKTVWILFTVTLINRTGTMVIPFLVLYLTRKLSFSPTQAGYILAFYGIGAIVTSPLSGKIVGIVAHPVWPGVSSSLHNRLSRIVPLVPTTSMLN